MGNIILEARPHVLPPDYEGYRGRTIPSKCLVTGEKYISSYVTTGIFKAGAGQSKRELKKALSIVFDLDLQDVPDLGTKIELCKKKEEELIFICEEQVEKVLPFLTEEVGQKPNQIVYTGTGFHCHFWLSPDYGFPAQVQGMKRRYKQIIKKIKKEFGYSFDDKMSDVGTALTRDVDTLNQKVLANPKKVQFIKEEWTSTSLLSSFEVVKEKKEKKEKKEIGVKKKKSGKPALLQGDEEIETKNGRMTVSSLYKVDFGEKIICRLNWVSTSSLNAWCNRLEDGSLKFFLNVEKYLDARHSHVSRTDSGGLVGCWIYKGEMMSNLILNKDGSISKILSNLETIVSRLYPSQIRENTRLNRVFVSAQIESGANPTLNRGITPLEDRHIHLIQKEVEKVYEAPLRKEQVYVAIDTVASKMGFDPVKAWVSSLRWDRNRRLDDWLPRLMGLNDSHSHYLLYSQYGLRMMLSIVRNIYIGATPSGVQHLALIIGGQGDGKSTFAATLGATHIIGREYFSDEEIKIDGKASDLIQMLQGKFLMEIPELASFNKKDANLIKSFITRTQMEGRLAYDRVWTKKIRSTYFIGTANDRKPLLDSTGNRRFLLLDWFKHLVGGWNLNYFREIIPQLYAEAAHRLFSPLEFDAFTFYEGKKCGEYNLTPDEIKLQRKHNHEYVVADQVEDALSNYLIRLEGEPLSLGEIRRGLEEEEHIKKITNKALSEFLSKEGWIQKRNSKKRFWIKESQKGSSKLEVEDPELLFLRKRVRELEQLLEGKKEVKEEVKEEVEKEVKELREDLFKTDETRRLFRSWQELPPGRRKKLKEENLRSLL